MLSDPADVKPRRRHEWVSNSRNVSIGTAAVSDLLGALGLTVGVTKILGPSEKVWLEFVGNTAERRTSWVCLLQCMHLVLTCSITGKF